MSDLISDVGELKANLFYLESQSASRSYRDFIQRGTCFVAYPMNERTHFAPSRFIGYKDNSFDKHAANGDKNGTETNPAISDILGAQPKQDDELEAKYRQFCIDVGVEPRSAGSFGNERKFWRLGPAR